MLEKIFYSKCFSFHTYLEIIEKFHFLGSREFSLADFFRRIQRRKEIFPYLYFMFYNFFIALFS